MGYCLCRIGAVAACRWTRPAECPTHANSHGAMGTPCPTRAPSRPSLASTSTQHQLLTILNTFGAHAGGVASDALEQWRPVDGPPLPNAQHIGTATEQWGAPCPPRAPPRQALASASIQPHLFMFLNAFVMHAGGVASDATGVRGQDLLGAMRSLPNCQHKTPP
jgi:hypothetical protein